MKQKVLFGLFVSLFLAITLTLSVGILVAGPSQAGANEILSNAPQLRDKDGNWNKNYLADFTDYISDRFYLRQELITLDNYLTAQVFQTSGNEKVMLGKDGWLFFAETLESFAGTDTLSQRELFSMAKNLELMQSYCEAQGKQFAFMVAPNKNSVYPEQMGDFGMRSELSDAARLTQLLKDADVNTVDLLGALQQQEEKLYFAHDSHWNTKGAALGADLINAAFGVKSSYFLGDFSQTAAHTGDLYEMVYPSLKDAETNPVFGGQLRFTYTSKLTKPDSIILQTAGNGEGKLLAYRDSFGNLLYPYLSDTYAESYFARSTTYDLTKEADFVLVELVERNLSYLLANVPVIESPVAEITLPQTSGGAVSVTAQPKDKAPEGCVRVKGTLPRTPDDDSCVYLVCDGQAYEAFLMEKDGFAVYVPENGEIQSLVYTVGGQFVMYEIT